MEVLIALFVRDQFVSPYGGDFLVVIMLYSFLKSFINIPNYTAAVGVLLFAYLIEFLQYIQIVNIFQLQGQRITTTVLGTQFEWCDMLAYTVGIGVVLAIERVRQT